MRICFFYQCDTKSATENKNKKGIYILFPSHIQKRKHFCLNKNMNIKRVCLWSYLFNCDKMIEKKLVVLSFHENHKRNPTHQTSINDCISLCEIILLSFCLFVCFCKRNLWSECLFREMCIICFQKRSFRNIMKEFVYSTKKERFQWKGVIFLWKLPPFSMRFVLFFDEQSISHHQKMK